MPGQQKVWHGIMTTQHSWMEEASLKTGHISAPKSVYTIAGYLRLHGDIGAFVVLFNAQPSMDKNGSLFKQLIQDLDHKFQMYGT